MLYYFTDHAYESRWDSSHLVAFDIIDTTTSPKLLVTTRIKQLMAKAEEVELELLGLQEAVAMLAAVAGEKSTQ